VFTFSSGSPARSTGRRWSSWSRGSSRSTLRTARATAARDLARRWRSIPSSSSRSDVVDRQGALAPWANSTSSYYEQVTEAIAERYGVTLRRPGRISPRSIAICFCRAPTESRPGHLPQPLRRRRSYATRFEGIVKNLQRRYRETESEWTREKIEEFMSLARALCAGAALRAESRAVLVGGRGSRTSARCRRGGRSSGWRRSSVGDRPSRRAADPAARYPSGCSSWRTSVSATCRWTARPRRCRAVRRKRIRLRRRSARRSSAFCTSSMIRRSGCTSAITPS